MTEIGILDFFKATLVSRFDAMATIDTLHKVYGQTFSLQLWGSAVSFTSDAEAIAPVLIEPGVNSQKSSDYKTVQCAIGKGLITQSGPSRRDMRRQHQPYFSHAMLESYAPLLNSHICGVLKEVADGKVRDLRTVASVIAIGGQLCCFFNSETKVRPEEIYRAIHDTLRRHAQFSGLALLLSGRARLWCERLIKHGNKKLRKQLHLLANDCIDAPTLLNARCTHAAFVGSSKEEIVEELLTYLIAGSEPTAATICWITILLNQNPTIANKLDAEIALTCSSDSIPLNVSKVTYAECIVLESLRLYPPIWLLGRRLQTPVDLDSGTIACDVNAYVSTWTMHRSTKYFPDPLKFDPDRWLTMEAKPRAFIPFGAGSRKCIASSFAIMHLISAITLMRQRVKIELDSQEEVSLKRGLTLSPRTAIWVTLRENLPVPKK